MSEDALAHVFAQVGELDFLSSGTAPWIMPDPLRARLRGADLARHDDDGSRGAPYNVTLTENRRVGAGLIAVA